MVGWTPCKIGGPSIQREIGFATSSGPQPTHASEPGRWGLPGGETSTELVLTSATFKDYRHCCVIPGGAVYYPGVDKRAWFRFFRGFLKEKM